MHYFKIFKNNKITIYVRIYNDNSCILYKYHRQYRNDQDPTIISIHAIYTPKCVAGYDGATSGNLQLVPALSTASVAKLK